MQSNSNLIISFSDDSDAEGNRSARTMNGRAAYSSHPPNLGSINPSDKYRTSSPALRSTELANITGALPKPANNQVRVGLTPADPSGAPAVDHSIPSRGKRSRKKRFSKVWTLQNSHSAAVNVPDMHPIRAAPLQLATTHPTIAASSQGTVTSSRNKSADPQSGPGRLAPASTMAVSAVTNPDSSPVTAELPSTQEDPQEVDMELESDEDRHQVTTPAVMADQAMNQDPGDGSEEGEFVRQEAHDQHQAAQLERRSQDGTLALMIPGATASDPTDSQEELEDELDRVQQERRELEIKERKARMLLRDAQQALRLVNIKCAELAAKRDRVASLMLSMEAEGFASVARLYSSRQQRKFPRLPSTPSSPEPPAKKQGTGNRVASALTSHGRQRSHGAGSNQESELRRRIMALTKQKLQDEMQARKPSAWMAPAAAAPTTTGQLKSQKVNGGKVSQISIEAPLSAFSGPVSVASKSGVKVSDNRTEFLGSTVSHSTVPVLSQCISLSGLTNTAAPVPASDKPNSNLGSSSIPRTQVTTNVFPAPRPPGTAASSPPVSASNPTSTTSFSLTLSPATLLSHPPSFGTPTETSGSRAATFAATSAGNKAVRRFSSPAVKSPAIPPPTLSTSSSNGNARASVAASAPATGAIKSVAGPTSSAPIAARLSSAVQVSGAVSGSHKPSVQPPAAVKPSAVSNSPPVQGGGFVSSASIRPLLRHAFVPAPSGSETKPAGLPATTTAAAAPTASAAAATAGGSHGPLSTHSSRPPAPIPSPARPSPAKGSPPVRVVSPLGQNAASCAAAAVSAPSPPAVPSMPVPSTHNLIHSAAAPHRSFPVWNSSSAAAAVSSLPAPSLSPSVSASVATPRPTPASNTLASKAATKAPFPSSALRPLVMAPSPPSRPIPTPPNSSHSPALLTTFPPPASKLQALPLHPPTPSHSTSSAITTPHPSLTMATHHGIKEAPPAPTPAPPTLPSSPVPSSALSIAPQESPPKSPTPPSSIPQSTMVQDQPSPLPPPAAPLTVSIMGSRQSPTHTLQQEQPSLPTLSTAPVPLTVGGVNHSAPLSTPATPASSAGPITLKSSTLSSDSAPRPADLPTTTVPLPGHSSHVTSSLTSDSDTVAAPSSAAMTDSASVEQNVPEMASSLPAAPAEAVSTDTTGEASRKRGHPAALVPAGASLHNAEASPADVAKRHKDDESLTPKRPRINPHWPLCKSLLRESCADVACPWQHVGSTGVKDPDSFEGKGDMAVPLYDLFDGQSSEGLVPTRRPVLALEQKGPPGAGDYSPVTPDSSCLVAMGRYFSASTEKV